MKPLLVSRLQAALSNGITPVAAAKATSPDPAGNEMPNGKRVCESPPVPTLTRTSYPMDHPGANNLIRQQHPVEPGVNDSITSMHQT
eukprot:3942663-Amphidinium_carterae.1